MPLVVGSRLGPYDVTALLGEGGMGQVYRATDTNLKREVAIKVLPAALEASADRLARFQREAEVLASLNHPNIAHIYGIERSGGTLALVMELVEGPTLAELLLHGSGRTPGRVRGLAVTDALRIARQIAAALETAHAQGIVHRDLKPANVKVKTDGTVKVLDFGLAKALGQASNSDLLVPGVATASPTLTSPAAISSAGVILGTAAYMSPEQARGQPVDKRSDVWAFGCVLFELLTGRPAFEGNTVSDVIANVLHTAPDWSALPADAAPLRGILQRCLEKDAGRRLRDIGDAALLLEDAVAAPSRIASSTTRPASRRWWTAAIITAALAGGGAVALFDATRSVVVQDPVARFQLASLAGVPFAADQNGQNVAISPDGSTMIYTSEQGGSTGLVVQRLDELQGRLLAGTGGGRNPIFSPDGKEVGFATVNGLKRVPVAGGPASPICTVTPYFNGASWDPQGAIVYAEFSFGLFRVAASGGEPERIAQPNPAKQEGGFATPFVLPDGHTIVYTVVMSDSSTRIAARRLGSDDATTLVEDGFAPRYLRPGYLVFARGNQLMGVRFDAATLQVTGSPVVVESGVFTKTADHASNFAVASNGTAAYIVGHDAARVNRLVWTDRHGSTVGALVNEGVEFPRNIRISPDGRRAVLTIGPPSNGQLWIYDLSGATPPQKLTFRDHGAFPVWSPDGKRIAFLWRTAKNSLSWIAADGTSNQPETIRNQDDLSSPLDWSPDGRYLLYQLATAPAKITVLNLSDGRAHAWLATPFADWGGRLSPSGRWMAYATDQTGAMEIWVRPFPGPGAPVRISSSGGKLPIWSRDEKEIFFENGSELLSARVLTETPEFRAAPPEKLFEGGFTHDDSDFALRFIDVAPDGRFLMVQPGAAAQASLVVSPHWDRELARLLAGR